MNIAVGEVLDNFITRSYNQYTYTNDPWMSLIPRVPIQEGRIPIRVDIPQQGDVQSIITGEGLVGPGNDANIRNVGTDYSVSGRQIATPDKIADRSISFNVREYTSGRYLAPDEDPREAALVYPKIPLQLSNIASEMSYYINTTILHEIASTLNATNNIISGTPVGTGNARSYRFDTTRDRIIGGTNYGEQFSPTIDLLKEAVRNCRSGIIGGMRPDIDDVYCVMSERMFQSFVDNNENLFRDTSMTGRPSTLWTVDHVSGIFGIRIILRNNVLRWENAANFHHPITGGSGSGTDRDTALLFRRGALLQYVSRPIRFSDNSTPEFLGSTHRWKINYGAGHTTSTTSLVRGVVALRSASIL